MIHYEYKAIKDSEMTEELEQFLKLEGWTFYSYSLSEETTRVKRPIDLSEILTPVQEENLLISEPIFSLRDQFAMSAMNGLLSNKSMTGDYSGTLPEWLSKRAYIIADEMLKTRKL